MALFKDNPVKTRLSFVIIAIHIGCLCFILFAQVKPKIPPKQTLVVKNISAPSISTTISTKTSEKKAVSPTVKPTAPPQKEPKKAVNSSPKNQAKPSPKKELPPEKKKAPPPPPKSAKKNTDSSSLQKSLKEIKESIAKIEAENGKIETKASLKVPPRLTPSTEFIALSADDYTSCLVNYLQDHLQLPDVGEVKVQLTLWPDGTVEKIVVLSTENEKNKKRLEEALPKLRFPPKEGSSKETFILTFCSKM